MTAKQLLPIIPDNIVVNKIYELRGLKVMLDSEPRRALWCRN